MAPNNTNNPSPSNAIATRPVNAVAPANLPDQNAILKALGLDTKDPKAAALVLVCSRYGLDPLLKHAVLISGSLYVTRDGLLHVAHSSGIFDGIEVEQLGESATHYLARASVWRKDMSRAFTYTGRYPKKGQLAATFGPEMAEKVAECRALRRAFDVSLCSAEERFDEEDTYQTSSPIPATVRSDVRSEGRQSLPTATPPVRSTPPKVSAPATAVSSPSSDDNPMVILLRAFKDEVIAHQMDDMIRDDNNLVTRAMTYRFIAKLANIPEIPAGSHPTAAQVQTAINAVAEFAHKQKAAVLKRSTPEPADEILEGQIVSDPTDPFDD